MRKIAISVLVLFLGINARLVAQHDTVQHDTVQHDTVKHGIGFIVGFGDQGILDVRYKYDVVLFQLQYTRALLPQEKTWGLDLVIQPQYNVTKFRKIDALPVLTDGFEFGVNVGLAIHKSIIENFLKMYLLASLGPHYVSGTPDRQAAGFIFSDNVFVGLDVKVFEKYHLDVRYGFRHISNAGLQQPNGGVNNLVISAGLMIDI